MSHLGLPGWIGVGAVAGLATGILVGEPAGALQPFGTAYVMLLESVVYPYIISSLLHGLASLSPKTAWRLFRKSWPFYVAAWGGTLGICYLLSVAFPGVPAPDMVDAAEPVRSGPQLLDMILPGNIFEDLTRNYVPAVVMIAVLFGVALQGAKGKERILDILALVRTACVKIWGWMVHLAPVAVFAMFAVTAGTIEKSEAGGLAAYIGLFTGVTFLLAFIAIPAAVSALAPVKYREVLSLMREALTLALVTTLSVVALPYIQKAAEKIARENGVDAEDHKEIIQTSLAVNYPLGQLGNFFVYFFMLFTAFYTGTSLSAGEQLALPFMTLVSCIGSPTSTVNAVDFLSSWLALPGEPLNLYIETMVITRYGQVALSVMGFAFLTFLMALNYYGKLRVQLPRLMISMCLVVGLVAGLSLGGRALLTEVLKEPRETYKSLVMHPDIIKGVEAKVYKTHAEFRRDYPRPELAVGQPVFDRIQRTQTLRVGYGPGIVPFSYLNKDGDLVGLDVACVYNMARGLNVKLVFAPVQFNNVRLEVERGVFDLFIGGVYVTEERMRWGLYSESYHSSPLALIAPSANLANFAHMDQLRDNPDLTLAVLDVSTMRHLAGRLFPQANKRLVKRYDELPGLKGWDAALWTFEQGGIWASGHPGYTAIKPVDMGAVMVMAYLMPRRAPQLQQFINHWLGLRKADGFLSRQSKYWIGGLDLKISRGQ
jgi:proton glutamate symport protein